MKIMGDIRKAFEGKHVILFILVDFTQAFDSECTEVFGHKICKLGFLMSACKWFLSYFQQDLK